MKYKTTQKKMREAFYCFSVSDGALQNLLKLENPIAYNAGVYGWNCDYYTFGNIAIVTGYRPHGKHVDYYTCKKYDDEAKKTLESNMTYDEIKADLQDLIQGFIREAKIENKML